LSPVSASFFSTGKKFLNGLRLTVGSSKLIRPRTIAGVGILSLLVLSFLFVPMAKANLVKVGTVPLGGYQPLGMAYDSGKGEVFAATRSQSSGTVSVISVITPNLSATVSVGETPQGVAYDGGRGEVFVTNHDSWIVNANYNVSVISDASNTVVAT